MTKSPKSKHFRYETDYHTECHLMTSADGIWSHFKNSIFLCKILKAIIFCFIRT